MLSIENIMSDPTLAERTVSHGGRTLALRLLTREDAEAFGAYLEGLSEETASLFGPHRLDADTARELCSKLDPSQTMRFGLFEPDGTMIAYFLLFPLVRDSTIQRYAAAGIELSSKTDCTFAPSVADAWQSKGLATAAMPAITGIARDLGFKRMVLSGGTQDRNKRGIAFYRKHGFRVVNDFITEPAGRGKIVNHDMILEW